jgi:ATP/ADP translocase
MFGHAVAAAGASAAGPAGVALLQGLVVFGALLYVFGKGAKFSLFKPAEEMVYITLDEDGRTRGKAAIDVVGAQVRGSAPRHAPALSSARFLLRTEDMQRIARCCDLQTLLASVAVVVQV